MNYELKILETETETERQRQRETETERQRETETERQRDRQKHRQTVRDTDRQRERERQTDRHRQTDRQTEKKKKQKNNKQVGIKHVTQRTTISASLISTVDTFRMTLASSPILRQPLPSLSASSQNFLHFATNCSDALDMMMLWPY